MKYFESVILSNTENLYNCLLPEFDNLSTNRVSCSVKLVNDKIQIEIKAKDETALKSIKSSVKKLVLIHTKTKKLIKNFN